MTAEPLASAPPPKRATPVRSRVLPLIVALAGLFLAAAAQAHSFDPALLDLREIAPGRFDVVWKLPAMQLAGAALVPHLPSLCRRIDGAAPAAAQPGQPVFWQTDCGAKGIEGLPIAVSGLEGTAIDVVLRITWVSGASTSGVLRSGSASFVVPARNGVPLAADAALSRLFASYLRIGIEHILFGYDHLAFVLGLCLLVASRRELLKTITAFTLAHSLTLALAVLGVVHVPPAPVEALIAFSIVLVARELLLRDGVSEPPASAAAALAERPHRRPRPWLMAAVFGLLHGLGFAGALQQVGLPAEHIPVALFAFNVGVEIGQLAFVLAVALPLAGLEYLCRFHSGLRRVPSFAIGALASLWTIERVIAFWPT